MVRRALALLCLLTGAFLACADEGVAALLARLGSVEVSEREAAFEALLAAGVRDPEPVLGAFPADPDDAEVRIACQRLRERIPIEHRRRRMHALAGDAPAARNAVDPFFDAPSRDRASALLDAVPAERRKEAVGILAFFLGSTDHNLRMQVILAIARHAPGEIDAVRPLVEDPDPSVRATAIDALWRMGDPGIPSRLVAYLSGDSVPERGVAEHILKERGDVSETTRIGALLDHKDPQVRVAALRVLGEFGTPVARDLVAARLTREDPDLRLEAVRILERQQGAGALPAVLAFLEDPDPMMRAAVLRVIGAHGMKDLMPRVLALISEESQVRGEAMRCLALIGGPDASPHLLPYLGSERQDVRYGAIQALSVTKDRSLIPGLMQMLEESGGKDRIVYAHAAGTLVGITWKDNETGTAALEAWWRAHKAACSGDDCSHAYGRQAR